MPKAHQFLSLLLKIDYLWKSGSGLKAPFSLYLYTLYMSEKDIDVKVWILNEAIYPGKTVRMDISLVDVFFSSPFFHSDIPRWLNRCKALAAVMLMLKNAYQGSTTKIVVACFP